MSNLVKHENRNSSVFDPQNFDHAWRTAQMLSKSDLVPKQYQESPQNIMIAIELANRTDASPIMVMQNVNVIQGRPSWSSQFIIAAINTCGKFEPLRFKIEKKGKKALTATVWKNKQPTQQKIEFEEIECIAYTKDANGNILESPPVSISMAIAEGWYSKSGSKWPTMPELMLRYRAASFFGRLYSPEILMGMKTTEEMQDIGETIDSDYEEIKPTLERVLEKVKQAKTPTVAGKTATVANETESVESEEYL
jgi:hypothetical protein